MKQIYRWLPLLLLLLCPACQDRPGQRAEGLQDDVEDYLEDKQATVGISVLTDTCTILAVNDTTRLPLLSVFKFPVAWAVLHHMERHGTPLDTVFHLTPDDLKTGTYSPLCMSHPDRTADVRMDSLLFYSVALSDNNACDVLLKYAGGPKAVERYIHDLGIADISLSATEDDMHREPSKALDNNATARAVSQMFQRFMQRDTLGTAHHNFLFRTLTATSTGNNKLRAGIPGKRHQMFGHKTGSSDRTADGLKLADNDAGFVVMPNGQRYYITVLVNNSMENDSVNAAIISTVSQMTYDLLSVSMEP